MACPSEIKRSCGTLFLVSTPIGNLDDMTFRAVNVLRECDVIFAEDTRRTKILLSRYDISGHLESYHSFNEHGRTPELLARVQAGEKIALVTDAGTPCVADPGFLLVREAVKAGIEPQIIPGVSSLTFAIAASGLPSDRFAFYGFLPVKSGRRAARIAEIAAEYRRLCLEAQDVVSAELRYAVPLAEGDIDRLKDFLCRRYHKSQAQLALVQDPALIGGFQLRVGDQVYDQSYRNALRQLKERLQSR